MLENVEATFGLHVSHRVLAGLVASRSSLVLVACGCFDAVISRKVGHAAIAQQSIDPI